MFRPSWAVIKQFQRLISVHINSTVMHRTELHITVFRIYIYIYLSDIYIYTGLFISPSGTSELDCAATKTDTAERSISIGRGTLKVFFVLGALAYLQDPPLGGSRDEKWRVQ